MRLSKNALGVVVGIVVVWALAIAGMVLAGSTTNQKDPGFPTAGALSRTVSALDRQGLTITAVSLADIYGEDYIAGAFLCDGVDAESFGEAYEVDTAGLELVDGRVPAGTSYLMLRSAEGAAVFDQVDRADVDLCATPLEGYFSTFSMLPLVKVGEDSWALAA